MHECQNQYLQCRHNIMLFSFACSTTASPDSESRELVLGRTPSKAFLLSESPGCALLSTFWLLEAFLKSNYAAALWCTARALHSRAIEDSLTDPGSGSRWHQQYRVGRQIQGRGHLLESVAHLISCVAAYWSRSSWPWQLTGSWEAASATLSYSLDLDGLPCGCSACNWSAL